MATDPPKPIYSTCGDDPDVGEALDHFVIGLAERIDILQDAEASGDFPQLASLAGQLAVDAEATGFGALASAAQALESACFGGDPKLARETTLDITEITQRIRLGHKGAA
jgi:HPt (histidine-containing phosphotransfer) domain-containing protein